MIRRYFIASLLFLQACASIPEHVPETRSNAWQAPQDTSLGQFFAERQPADAADSGVRLVPDPRDAFKVRYGLAALAEHTLDLQYYLWKGDLTGRLLLWRALQAADRGVRVRLLIDDIYHKGRDLTYAHINAHPFVEIRVFNPHGNRRAGRMGNFLVNKKTLNHRMHNKIFLVDNAVAVLGGRNIGDDYFGIDPKLNFHDLDVLAVGEAARQTGAAFDLYWNSSAAVPINLLVTDEVEAADLGPLRGELEAGLEETLGEIPYKVPRKIDGILDALEQIASELTWADAEVIVDPLERFDGNTESAFQALGRTLLSDISEDLIIQTAYLIPDEGTMNTIETLAGRGVRVRIMTNSALSNNHISVHAHYMKHREPIINAGAELYELRADAELLDHYREVDSEIADSHAGLHTKALVADGRISVIGSYNMDPRSRIWNSEIALVVRNEAFGEIVREEMLEEFQPGNAYRLQLDEAGGLLWTIDAEDGPEQWTHDPGTSSWRRFITRLISWIPIENEL